MELKNVPKASELIKQLERYKKVITRLKEGKVVIEVRDYTMNNTCLFDITDISIELIELLESKIKEIKSELKKL